MELTKYHTRKADVVMCLGTSLRVQPANKIPLKAVKRGGKLIICNLQKTTIDDKAAVKIHTRCDDLMRFLMQELNIPIPVYRRVQKLLFRATKTDSNWLLEVLRECDKPCKGVDSIQLVNSNGESITLDKAPFLWNGSGQNGGLQVFQVSIHLGKDYEQKTASFSVSFDENSSQLQHEFTVLKHVVDYNDRTNSTPIKTENEPKQEEEENS